MTDCYLLKYIEGTTKTPICVFTNCEKAKAERNRRMTKIEKDELRDDEFYILERLELIE